MQGKDLPPIHPSPTLLRISKGTMLRGWRNGQMEEWALERIITLAAATHYGFTVDDLKEKRGLKEFFGFNSYD